MSRVAKYLAAYQSFHTKCITQITHFIGVPLIIFALLILFGWVHVRVPNLFDMPLAWLLTLIVLIYYFFLDITLAAAMTVFLVLLNLLAAYFSQPVPTWHAGKIFIITFVLGWALQFIGHIFESKKPAFLSNLKHLIIAPLFLMAELFFCCGWKKDLQIKMAEAQQKAIL